MQVLDHAAYEELLLVILLAEYGQIRAYDFQEGQYHCGDTAKVPGTTDSLQELGKHGNFDDRR
jgi:hypothetical protein